MKIKFSIKKVDFIIYSKMHAEFIKSKILKSHSTYVMSSNIFEIPLILNPKFIRNFLFNCIKYRHFKSMNSIKKNYKITFINHLKPKGVLTLIDNDEDFHYSSFILRNINFYAIQNGRRPVPHKESVHYKQTKHLNHLYKYSHFFCWGNFEKDCFQKYGYDTKKFIPVGSVFCDYYFKEISPKIDILFIPSFFISSNHYFYSREKINSLIKFCKYLNRFVEKFKYNVVVYPKHGDNSINGYCEEIELFESEFYLKYLNPKINFVPKSEKKNRIYELISNSKVIVSELSSIVHEALGKMKKASIFKLHNEKEIYDFTSNKVINEINNYEEFEIKLLKQLKSFNQFSSTEISNAKYVCKFPIGNNDSVTKISKYIMKSLL